MTLASITTDFMRRMPAGLRPNPYNIEEFLMNLSANGWGIEDMVTAVMASRPMQPGHVFARLRAMQEEPAPLKGSTGNAFKDMKHTACTDANHTDCKICHCNVCKPNCAIPHQHERWPHHHVNSPLPDWFREQFPLFAAQYRHASE